MFFIPYYIVILFVTIVIDYLAGIWIEDSQGKRRKYYLWGSIVSTCLVLFIFKYYNFFIGNFNELAKLIGWNYSLDLLGIILPIGLSFHTFQSLSYVVEVYRGHQKAERHFGIYSLYVMFYPQLVAGPIERPQNILHQFYEKHNLNYADVSAGIKLMIWGLFKKVVIADNIAEMVDIVFAHPDQMSWQWLLLGSYLFAIQIYCDFSGYSDMAIGAARVMGYRLMENFNTPYISNSIKEFWSRWHISLSTWFRDYVYIPLGGNRVPGARKELNLLAVFAVSGFWHGANWTFVVWGLLHGFYNVLENMMKKYNWFRSWIETKVSWKRTIGAIIVFQFVVLGWIFFRATSIHDAWLVIKGILTGQHSSWAPPEEIMIFGYLSLAYKLLLVTLFMLMDLTIHRFTRGYYDHRTKHWFRLSFYAYLAALIVLIGYWGDVEFIYFQF
jgi:D-alanyl-lipoteichoic acid acyltransferase DltB (MBOAT superfamily)